MCRPSPTTRPSPALAVPAPAPFPTESVGSSTSALSSAPTAPPLTAAPRTFGSVATTAGRNFGSRLYGAYYPKPGNPNPSPASQALNLAGGGLNLANALDPNVPTAGRALSGAAAANAAAGSGILGSTAATGAGYLGPALALASLGYNISSIAGRDDLSTKQKAGASGRTAVETVAGATNPYAGAALLVSAIGQKMQRSGSPEVRKAGLGLDYTVRPGFEKAGMDIISGARSPKAAIANVGGIGPMLTDLALGPLSGIARSTGLYDALGMGGPTEGTGFRHNLNKVLGRFPEFSDFKGTGNYAAPTGTFSPEATAAANGLASAFVGDNLPQYRTQTANILLNQYGNDIVGRADAINRRMADEQAKKTAAEAPAGAAAAAPQNPLLTLLGLLPLVQRPMIEV